jgi:hypothetical protein
MRTAHDPTSLVLLTGAVLAWDETQMPFGFRVTF